MLVVGWGSLVARSFLAKLRLPAWHSPGLPPTFCPDFFVSWPRQAYDHQDLGL